MEWKERYDMHLAKADEHFAKAKEALARFNDHKAGTHRDWTAWEEYLKEYHLHEKHRGIAQAMYTKKYGR